MDFKEWHPKGFDSWRSYYRWQHFCDVVGLILSSALIAFAIYTCGG